MKTLTISLAALAIAMTLVADVRPADGVTITPDVVYGHKDGLALTFDVFQPESKANGAGVLFMVSGGWVSRWAPPEKAVVLFEPLIEEGFTVFAVRHGSSPRYVIPEAVEDVRRSVRYIRLNADRFGVDADRLGVYGGSAGGHLSLVLGTASDDGRPGSKDATLRASDRVAAVVAYFPPTDLDTLITDLGDRVERYPALEFDAAKRDDYSPLEHASPDDPPTLLVHGDKDDLVPIEHSHKMLAAFKEQGVPAELIVIRGAGHGFRGDDNARAREALVAWFVKHLGK